MKQLDNINKILVVDLAFIGDVILATPTLRALRTAYPEARITMLAVPLTAAIAAMDPFVDEVLVYDKRGRDKGIFGMLRMGRRLKSLGFDLAVCMNFAVRGAVVAWLAGIPHRLGYAAQHAGLFLTMTASPVRTKIQHESLNHLEVLQPLGLTITDASLALIVPEAARSSLAAKRQRYEMPADGYLVLCPFGSYAKKNLSLGTAAHLVRHWSQRRPVYLIGGPAEASGLDLIARTAGLPLTQVLAGTLTLPELAAFLADAGCLVTVDTGPLHVAQAVGCRTVALFGPTDPAVWGPRGKTDVVLYKKLDCSPCWGKGTCQDNLCLGSITAMEIIRVVG